MKCDLKKKIEFLFLGLVLGLVAGQAKATPQLVRIDGQIYDATGNPIDGSMHTVTVNVYTAASGGSSLWTSSGYSVTPTNGRFTVDLDASLGGVTSLMNTLSVRAPTDAVWFEMNYDGNIVRPRLRSRGSAFAVNVVSADSLRGVSISTLTPVTGNVLTYNGGAWGPVAVTASGISAVLKAGDSMTGTLDSVTNIVSTATITAATVNVTGLTPSRLVLTDASKNLTSLPTAVTDAQLSYLATVTGAIQTQLNAKQSAFALAPLVSGSTAITVTGTGDVIGTSPVLGVSTASSSSAGIVTSSDWNTFNAAGSSSTLVARTGDTMSGTLGGTLFSVTSFIDTSLVPTALVRANASSDLVAVTASVSDYALSGLADVTAAIEPQIASKIPFYSVYAPGTIMPFGGSRLADTTSGSTLITNFIGTTTLMAGQQVAGPGIPSGAVIVAIPDPTTIQISVAATATAAGAKLVIPPYGYLLCDGSAVSRSTYGTLYEVLDSSWGAGNGTTTFNLPDLRGRFLRGQDWGVGLDLGVASRTAANSGGNTGDAVGSSENSSFASHTHTLTDPGHNHSLSDPGHAHGFSNPAHAHSANTANGSGSQDFAGANVSYSNTSGISSFSATTGVWLAASTTGITISPAATGVTLQNSGSADTRPSNSSINYIIKY